MNIICMKWGDKFPAEYVNRLYAMVVRNLSSEFRFICFTESSDGIRSEVEIQNLPELWKLEYWPDEGVPSFKNRCCPSWIKFWFEAPSIPVGAKVILFHGLPNPPEAITGHSGKWYRHIQPSPWIKNYCTE